MALYWRLKSVPELADLPKDVRKRVWREAAKKSRDSGATKMLMWCWFGLSLAIGGTGVYVLLRVVSVESLGGWVSVVPAAFTITSMLISAAILSPLAIHTTRPYIREYLTSGV